MFCVDVADLESSSRLLRSLDSSCRMLVSSRRMLDEGFIIFIFLELISTKSFPAPFPSEKFSKLPSVSGSSFSESSTYISGLDRPPKSGSSSLKSSG